MPGKDATPSPSPPPTSVSYHFPWPSINNGTNTWPSINIPDGTDTVGGSSGSSGSDTSVYSRFFIVAIVCLCFVASLVFILHLYLRYIRNRHMHHRRRQTVSLFHLTTLTEDNSNSPRAGLDLAAISSIPFFRYQKGAGGDDQNSGETAITADCAVCLSLLEEGEVVRMLPACRHVFHATCIDKWLSSSASCPVCRADVRAQPQVRGQTPAREQLAVVEVTDTPAQDQTGTKEEAEAGGSVPMRLSSSFRRMLSGDRSTRRVQDDAGVEDLERG